MNKTVQTIKKQIDKLAVDLNNLHFLVEKKRKEIYELTSQIRKTQAKLENYKSVINRLDTYGYRYKTKYTFNEMLETAKNKGWELIKEEKRNTFLLKKDRQLIPCATTADVIKTLIPYTELSLPQYRHLAFFFFIGTNNSPNNYKKDN